MISATRTTSKTLLQFSLHDFNDYDDELVHPEIPTMERRLHSNTIILDYAP